MVVSETMTSGMTSKSDKWASIRKRTRGDGGTSYVLLYWFDDRQRPLTFRDELAAQALQAAIRAHGVHRALEMHGIALPARDENPITVSQWLTAHVDQLTGVEQKCIDDYRRYIRLNIGPTIGDIPLSALTEADISRFVTALQDAGNSPKTIRNKYRFLSGALSKAVGKHLTENPCAGRRLPRVAKRGEDTDDGHDMRMLSRDEFDRLHAAIDEHWQPLVEFLVRSGCRWGEATALKPGDVNRKAGIVRIRRAWKTGSTGHYIGATKTERSRRDINVSTRILNRLDYSHEWLFVNHDGGPVRYHRFRRAWDRAVKTAKLAAPLPTPHDLRHTCASWLITAGQPIAVVSRHLGHENIQITVDTYTDIDRASFAAAAAAMDKLLD